MYKAVVNTLLKFANAQVRRLFQTLVIFGVLMIGLSLTALGDYLDELNAEATDTGNLIKQGKQNKNSPSEVNSSDVKSDIKEEFEKLLEFELPSTYKFYIKLPPQDQNKVIQTYSQNKKMSSASKMIFDLYFESNKKK